MHAKVRQSEAQAAKDKDDLGRVAGFSDGIFAFAITLLVLDVSVPVGGKLLAELLAVLPKVLIYVISFCMIGSYWYAHHRTFRHIEHYTGPFVLLNLVALFFITFLPATTALLGDYFGEPVAVMIYAANICLAGLAFWVLWRYAAAGYRLVEPEMSPALISLIGRRFLYLPVGGMIAIPIALFSPVLALLCLVLAS